MTLFFDQWSCTGVMSRVGVRMWMYAPAVDANGKYDQCCRGQETACEYGE